MSELKTTTAHVEFYQIMARAMKSEPFASMPAEELLAVAANFLGKLCAYQDQRRFNQQQVMEIVIKNLETGNRQAVAEVHSTGGVAN